MTHFRGKVHRLEEVILHTCTFQEQYNCIINQCALSQWIAKWIYSNTNEIYFNLGPISREKYTVLQKLHYIHYMHFPRTVSPAYKEV